MTDQEIYEALKIEDATEETKQACLQNINTVVEARTVGALGDLITSDQIEDLERMEAHGATKEEMLDWLSDNIADAEEMRQVITRDYVEELGASLS